MVIQRNKGQSLLEYAILLSVVVAALLLMQFIVKRGYEGSLKDSSDKMGDRYSLANGTSLDVRKMLSDQVISDKQGTNKTLEAFLPANVTMVSLGGNTTILAASVLEHVDRRGGTSTINNTVRIDSVKNETVRWDLVVPTLNTSLYADPTI